MYNIRRNGKAGTPEAGGKYCADMEEASVMDKWKKIYSELRARNKSERLREIQEKMQKSQATTEELCKYAS